MDGGSISAVVAPERTDGRRRISRPMSLQPEHVAALVHIADDEGHGNVSRVVQDLIEREMRSRMGRDWRASLSEVAVPA